MELLEDFGKSIILVLNSHTKLPNGEVSKEGYIRLMMRVFIYYLDEKSIIC